MALLLRGFRQQLEDLVLTDRHSQRPQRRRNASEPVPDRVGGGSALWGSGAVTGPWSAASVRREAGELTGGCRRCSPPQAPPVDAVGMSDGACALGARPVLGFGQFLPRSVLIRVISAVCEVMMSPAIFLAGA